MCITMYPALPYPLMYLSLDNLNSFGDEKIGERKKGEGGRKYGIYCENRHILYQNLNHSISPLLIFSERSKSVYNKTLM